MLLLCSGGLYGKGKTHERDLEKKTNALSIDIAKRAYLLHFYFVPLLCVIYLSFTNYSILSPGHWVGLSNYERMLEDQLFMGAVKNTFVFWIVSVLPQMALGLVLAVLLNSKIKGLSFSVRGCICRASSPGSRYP